MWAPVFIIVCVSCVTCCCVGSCKNKRLSIRRLTPIVHLLPILGGTRVCDWLIAHTCAVEDLVWFGTQPLRFPKISLTLNYSLGFAVARSDRFTKSNQMSKYQNADVLTCVYVFGLQLCLLLIGG